MKVAGNTDKGQKGISVIHESHIHRMKAASAPQAVTEYDSVET